MGDTAVARRAGTKAQKVEKGRTPGCGEGEDAKSSKGVDTGVAGRGEGGREGEEMW
jgi:hypothetical protein